jgi:hypothetical protein
MCELCRRCEFVFSYAKSLETNFAGQTGLEIFLHRVEINMVVGTLWSGEAGFDGRKIKLHQLRVCWDGFIACICSKLVSRSQVMLNF